MKPKRDHSYQEKPAMSPTEAKALATFLVWGALVAILVLADRHFGIFLVAAIATMSATLFIWAGEAMMEGERESSADTKAALHLLKLLEDDEIELLKSRLKAQIQTNNTVISHEENTVIGQQILIR
jgi:hypothetical protein